MAISQQVRDYGLLYTLEVSVVTNKEEQFQSLLLTKKNVKTEDSVSRSLTSLGVKVLAIMVGTFDAFWDVLLPSVEDAVTLTLRTLETKQHLMHTEILGRRRITVAIFEVPSYLLDENLAAYLLQFGEIVSGTHDNI